MSTTETPPAQVTKTGVPVRNLWYMLLYVWDVVSWKNEWKSEVEDAPTLDALLAMILGKLIQQRLRIGLGRDYRDHHAEIAGLRGRVDFTETLKRLSLPRGKTYCHFQVFSGNVLKNQIVRSTLARLVQTGNFGTDTKRAGTLRAQLRRIVSDMQEIDLIQLKSSVIRREQLQRHDLDYRIMLAICLLLNQNQMPTEDAGQSGLPAIDRDSYRLFDVYEKFVAKFYEHHLEEWTVFPQQKLVWPADEVNHYLPEMRPDLTLEHRETQHRIVLDTKFTAKILSGRWEKKRFATPHLYQLYAYLKSQEHHSEQHRCCTGILLYPAVSQRLSEVVRMQGHNLRWETVDLSESWEKIEFELLSIPSTVLTQNIDGIV